MPLRPVNREQAWLLPPALDDLLAQDHPVRFVGEFVDGLPRDAWSEMEIDLDGDPLGAPAYQPRVLLNVWLYGFMTGIRSSRKLGIACREQIPFLWLTGCQHPDHNPLWRFYQTHRQSMRQLLKRTVRTAVEVGRLDRQVQAVDGTKVAANAAGDQTCNLARPEKLLARTEDAISELEAQNKSGDEPHRPACQRNSNRPRSCGSAFSMPCRIQHAMSRLAQDHRITRVNLTDQDAQLMKGRQGIMPG